MYLLDNAPDISKHVPVSYRPPNLNLSPHQANSLPVEELTFSFSRRQVTIGELSDNVLLNIFRYYLDAFPQHWPRLVHICRRWRRIVFASQQALHLRIFCTHGTPVLKIVVKYGGSVDLDPPAPEDEDNILAALKQSDRVSSISLTITKSLLEKLSAIERTFSELEDLVLLSQDGVQLTLPSAFIFFILAGISWTFSSTKFSILCSPHQKRSRMPCPGWPSFNHFLSISALPLITPGYLDNSGQRAALFFLFFLASIFEDLLGTWNAL
ncbi:hypothetical protein EDB83DRAFT_2557225 [Lactarius deliciosus]|nr:hypothetical protein EDB83DRAFT_2557225 [Lactarius deliciosus]